MLDRRKKWIFAAALILAVWLVISGSLVPGMFSDQSVFASTAERLLRGDRLYVDVWDNKDPFIYYSLALVRGISPLAQIPLEVIGVLICCLAVFWISRGLPSSPVATTMLAFAVVPVIVTGLGYEAGMTELPAVTIGLVGVALLLRGRWGLAGLTIGILAMVKIILLPVLGLAAVALAIRRRTIRGCLVTVLIATVTILLCLGIVAGRGELGAYGQMLVANFRYAGGGDTSHSLAGGMLQNLTSATGPGTVAACLAALGLLLVPRPSGTRGNTALDELGTTVFVVLAGVIVVLLFTGKWPHHGSYLALPVVLAATWAASALAPALSGLSPARVSLLGIVATIVLGGSWPVHYLSVARAAPIRWASLTVVSPATHALDSLGRGHTYARIGQNDDRAHAYGLDGWRLACPAFHQYPFQSYDLLHKTLVCLPRADALIVAASAAPVEGRPDWNRYLADAEKLLAQQYTCTPVDDVRLCVRNGL